MVKATKNRVLVFALTAVLAFAGAFSMVGCATAASDEDQIKQAIGAELDNLKAPSEDKLKEYLNSESDGALEEIEQANSMMSEYGVDLFKFMTYALKHFDYEVGDVTIDGDKATANVTIKNIDLQSTMTDITNDLMSTDMSEALSSPEKIGEIYNTIFNKFYEAVDNADASQTVSNETTVELNKTDNGWEIDKNAVGSVVDDALKDAM